MAIIVPFRGVRYNQAQAGQLADLVTPPYDVIYGDEQKRYYEKNDYNIIRLEYGESHSNDDNQNNRYTRAHAFFKTWLEERILVHDGQPAIYLYEQEFTASGSRLTRSGFIAGVGLEDYETGIILPHEETLSKAKEDRLELLRHCHANFSPIFGLYDDSSLTVEKIASRYKQNTADEEFTDENGESHRLWMINDPEDLAAITNLFKSQKVYIADGHHRYETALNYYKEMRAKGDSRFSFCLMTLVNLHDPGLVIYPTHRLVKNVAGLNAKEFLNNLEKIFTITTLPLPDTDREAILSAELDTNTVLMADNHAFLLYLGDEKLHRLLLRRAADNQLMAAGRGIFSPAWRSLDVAILQSLVLEGMLGIDKGKRAGGANLAYTREEADALRRVDAGEFQAVFYLNPTRVREVTEVAAAGDRMPQKSTYFYPKLITGLVINDFTV
ncbi:MAG: DUF1015 domain-containing protein [Dethiobacter sp.]|jgi:uncharacterized protein (DUF1015 family)|nr:DUF1015 domain-containing protein [Dethiobacter sp.]MBS3901418.1 DUF1015 domain-containing protein [Dethiobacter sp.]MBS3988648.1 DUF1015 domain-containing protein [Dethiobacter sp.]